jgi:site-specific recombinase
VNDAQLDAALALGAGPGADAVDALTALAGYLRPTRQDDDGTVAERLRLLVERLERDAPVAALVRGHFGHLFGRRRLVGFFAESGILPPTGFFTELGRIVAHRLLPELPADDDLRAALARIFPRRDDWVWLRALPKELTLRLWAALAGGDQREQGVGRVREQMLEALLVLGYRIGGIDAEREFERLGSAFADNAPVFRAVAGEAQRFADGLRAWWLDASANVQDERHLLVLVDQCEQLLRRVRRASMKQGTSLHLTYLLQRAEQSLERIKTLALLLGADLRPEGQVNALLAWDALMARSLTAENRRHSVRKHLSDGASVLALRVTDNAARTGEHYVADTPLALRGMWRAAMGAGAIIAVLALLKIFASKLDLAPIGYAIEYSLIYGLGFVLAYVLHLTIATKQPAMTAQTIANRLGELKPGRGLDLTPAVDLIVAVARTQFAAILGNVMIALPTAIAISLALAQLRGAPIIDVGKAAHLLDDLDPLSWLPLYAAIAGVFLFLSGVLTGFFDNWSTYARLGARIERLRWLRAILGVARSQRIAHYVEEHLGGLMGNFLFGCMLGSAGTIGLILGLPIDIRHIAFAAANLGYALVAFDFALPWPALVWAALGLALIGAINLTVSFALALWMALRARGVVFTQTGPLLAALWQRVRREPGSLFTVGRPAAADSTTNA